MTRHPVLWALGVFTVIFIGGALVFLFSSTRPYLTPPLTPPAGWTVENQAGSNPDGGGWTLSTFISPDGEVRIEYIVNPVGPFDDGLCVPAVADNDGLTIGGQPSNCAGLWRVGSATDYFAYASVTGPPGEISMYKAQIQSVLNDIPPSRTFGE